MTCAPDFYPALASVSSVRQSAAPLLAPATALQKAAACSSGRLMHSLTSAW